MPNHIIQKIFMGIIVLALAGCGVSAKSYVQVKDRVDQDLSTGNAGYLMGGPKEGDAQEDRRSTRRVYVLEFTKDHPVEDEETLAAPTARRIDTYIPPPPPEPAPRRTIQLPNFDDMGRDTYVASEPSGPTSAVEYTIQKNDTMQKIAKKFYDSYSKWPKIYEANRERISDPNKIKPGVTIVIPPLQ